MAPDGGVRRAAQQAGLQDGAGREESGELNEEEGEGRVELCLDVRWREELGGCHGREDGGTGKEVEVGCPYRDGRIEDREEYPVDGRNWVKGDGSWHLKYPRGLVRGKQYA